jgi:hypothetical protein
MIAVPEIAAELALARADGHERPQQRRSAGDRLLLLEHAVRPSEPLARVLRRPRLVRFLVGMERRRQVGRQVPLRPHRDRGVHEPVPGHDEALLGAGGWGGAPTRPSSPDCCCRTRCCRRRSPPGGRRARGDRRAPAGTASPGSRRAPARDRPPPRGPRDRPASEARAARCRRTAKAARPRPARCSAR